MAHGFVQEDAGPARAQHHGHFASRGGRDSRLVRAAFTASSTYLLSCASSKYARPKRPPAAGRATSRRPFCSAITVIDRRTSGRTSAASVPSARPPAPRRIRWPGRHHLCHAGSWRGRAAQALQQATFGGAVQRSNGVYTLVKAAAGGNLFGGNAHTASLRHGRNGSARCARHPAARPGNVIRIRKSGLFAAHARTPTPWSMLKEPVFTMPSSRLQPSLRVYWKYRSASSTWWARISPAHGPGGSSSPKRRQQQFTGDINALGGGCALRRGGRGAKGHRRILGGNPPAPPQGKTALRALRSREVHQHRHRGMVLHGLDLSRHRGLWRRVHLALADDLAIARLQGEVTVRRCGHSGARSGHRQARVFLTDSMPCRRTGARFVGLAGQDHLPV